MLYKATPPAEQNLVELLNRMGNQAQAISHSLEPVQPAAANDNPRAKIMALWGNRDDMTGSTAYQNAPAARTTLDRNNLFASNIATVIKPLHTPTPIPTQKLSVFRVNKDATDTTPETPVVQLPTRNTAIRDLNDNVITFRPRTEQTPKMA